MTASKGTSPLFIASAVVALVLAANPSNAFISPGAINQATRQEQFSTFQSRNQGIDRPIRLYAATASGSGIDVIDSWKLLPDGRIQGVMANSGDKVLTSPLKNKRGLRADKTVRTISGSRYKLGTPAGDEGKSMSPAQIGTPRATQAGVNVNGNKTSFRATQPLMSAPTASQDRALQEFAENKGRATMPLKMDEVSGGTPDFLTPIIAGASSIAIGAVIGSGVVSGKGVDLDKLKNLPDPSKVLESTKSLNLPDIKALRAPVIPSPDISLPKLDGIDVPKLPEVNLPNVNVPDVKLPGLSVPDVKLPSVSVPDVKFPSDIKLPNGIKLPDAPSVNIDVAGGVKSLGNTAAGAIGSALENNGVQVPSSPFAKKATPKVQMDPYRVPMPYLDEQEIQAKKEAAEREEAARAQKLKEEEEARLKAEQEVIAQQARERELARQQRAEEEARIRKEADDRVQKAEQEAAQLREEVERARVALLEKEKAAADEAARLKEEAELALMKERAAKEEFTKKLQEAELAQMRSSEEFSLKLKEAQEAAAKERVLAEETIAKQQLAEEATTRQLAATNEVRKASVGARAARKASYASPASSTYEAWQDRQRSEYQARVGIAAAEMQITAQETVNPFSSSDEKLSTYQKWQRSIVAKQVTAMSAESVTSAYATGAPASLASQVVSGAKLSEAATILNGDLGYKVAGGAALAGSYVYAYNYYKIQDELEEAKRRSKPKPKKNMVPPSPAKKKLEPTPPIKAPENDAKKTSSVTMAINSKERNSSVTKPVPPLASPEIVPPASNLPPPLSPPEISSRVGSYLESMSDTSGSQMKASYSPFANAKKNDDASPQDEEKYTEPRVPDSSDTLVNGASYLEAMSGPKDGLKSSYSPFGTTKVAANNDSVYSAPDVAQSEPKSEPSTEPTQEESVNKGGSYLDSMSGSDGSSLKSSYSPFGTVKVVSDDSSHSPPDVTQSPLSFEAMQEGAVNGIGSYLDSMDSSDGSSLKSSYSPFGTPKKALSDSLYSPPDTGSSPESILEEPMNGSYLDSMGTNDGSGLKASYSPFASSKESTQTPDNAFYNPSTTPMQEPSTEPLTNGLESSALGSYLDDLNDSTQPPVKTSYSPFGSKPKPASDNRLYSPDRVHETSLYHPSTLEDSLPSEKERDATPVSNYLERLVIPLSSADIDRIKKSYSPFSGNGKPKAPENDPLYRDPTSKTELPSEEERDTIPVTNYLQRLIVPLGGVSSKKSFSPFGFGNWKKSKGLADDTVLTNRSSEKVSYDVPSEQERDMIPVANYLDRLIVPVVSSAGKDSFSPFGKAVDKSNIQASDKGSLYKPPSDLKLSDLPSEEERDSTPVGNYLERLILPVSPKTTGKTKPFSPLGKGVSKSEVKSGRDASYEPPAQSSSPSSSEYDLLSEEERDKTPVANYLERLIVPIASASAGKKSFSPFGKGPKKRNDPTASMTLYDPPVKSVESSNHDLPSEDERDVIPVVNYLDHLIVPLRKEVNESEKDLEQAYSPSTKSPTDLSSNGEPNEPSLTASVQRLLSPLSTLPRRSKKSYSPFGSNGGGKYKQAESNSNVPYNPPSQIMDPPNDEHNVRKLTEAVERILVADKKKEESNASYSQFLSDREAKQTAPESYGGTSAGSPKDPGLEKDSEPMANYSEYLEQNLRPISNPKKSYSPFKAATKQLEPTAPENDALEQPLETSLTGRSSFSYELPPEEERDSIPVANYLDRLVVPLKSLVSKGSYSPFRSSDRRTKTNQSNRDTLYSPPANTESSGALEPNSTDDAALDEEERDNIPAENFIDHLVVPLTEEDEPEPKKTFSAFGETIPDGSISTYDDMYKPPFPKYAFVRDSMDVSDEVVEAQEWNQGGDYLESLSDSKASLKSSYSPFGSHKSIRDTDLEGSSDSRSS